MDYLDVEQKINYHKEQIIKEFIKKGIYPNNELIANKLNNINNYLALFKNYNIPEGTFFDTAKLNKQVKLIYNDFIILYDILYKLQQKEYYNLQCYINSYINEFYSIVKLYKDKADYDTHHTSLDKTLLFKNSSFDITNENSTTILDLGNITLEDTSTIACIANINNIDVNNIMFKFINNENILSVAPYNYLNESLIIPGEKDIKEYEITLNEDENISNPLCLNIDKELENKNKYIILGGKNKLLINNVSDSNYSLLDSDQGLGDNYFKKHTIIDFYVYKGDYISFNYNKKPLKTNFPITSDNIKINKDIEHFYIECDEDFTFNVTLNTGTIYALKENGVINNKQLYYTGIIPAYDYLVLEEQENNTHDYNVKLYIYNDNNNDFDIDNIIIKQLSE